jgi:hypothetical protein
VRARAAAGGLGALQTARRVAELSQADSPMAQGEHEITLSTANTYSYEKKRMPLRQCVPGYRRLLSR